MSLVTKEPLGATVDLFSLLLLHPILITFLAKGGYVFGRVCLSVCLWTILLTKIMNGLG